MADVEMEQLDQPVAGPSRQSPPTSPARIPLNDVEMEDQAMSNSLLALAQSQQQESEVHPGLGSQSQEAAELLLGFSTLEPRHDEIPTLDPPSPSIPHTGIEPPRDPIQDEQSGMYPYTPPDEPRANNETPSISTSNPYPSLPHLQPILPSSPVAADSPEAGPSKLKQKRKRLATNSVSRRTSTDPVRPLHFMGEDNEIIRCICGIDEDDGLTIQCESCYAWQHALCFGYANAASAPEIYYCEQCSPRAYDQIRAREVQVAMRDKRERERPSDVRNQADQLAGSLDPGMSMIPGIERGGEKVKRKGGKRARMGSVHEPEGAERGEKDASPGTMAPPTVKPRRKPGPKPKPKPTSTTPLESTPAPTYYPTPQTTNTTEAEDVYFRIEPWTLEYTPVRDNIVRGREARRIMGKMYREWVDAEEDEEATAAAKAKAVAGPSGLPSPTETGLLRFSPDNLFPGPDYAILAPPVPPVTLLGPDLPSLGHPIIVKTISHSLSFLPLSYSDATPLAGPYTRPALYGVFASDAIPSSSFIGEFRAEILDCETYRKDPVNQYPILGITKPHVQPIGPPVNLMLDSRGYGCELRFIRPGCHPNVVLRPLLFRTSETEAPKLRFGIFASGDIARDEELVLAWAWDDSHVVHALRSLIHPTTLADGYPGRPSFGSTLPSTSPVIHSLLDKFEVVLTHLLGTFSSCACKSLGNCAIAQMRYLVEQRDEEQSRAGRRGQRADVGELVGAVRGWRRREEEVEGAKKWNIPEEIMKRPWAKVVADQDVEERQDIRPVAGLKDLSKRVSASPGLQGETEIEVADRSGSEIPSDVEEDVEMGEDDEREEEEGAEESTRLSRAVSRANSSPRPNTIRSQPRQASRSESPLTSSPRPSTPPMSRSPRPNAIAPSSALSSAPRSRPRTQRPESQHSESDDGNVSDATTATVPRSLSSDEQEDEEEGESELEIETSAMKANGGPGGRKRRVLSPVVESNLPSPDRELKEDVKPRRIRKDGKEDKRFKPRDPAAAGSNKRQRNRILSSPGTEDDTMDLPGNRRMEKDGNASALFPEELPEEIPVEIPVQEEEAADVEMEEEVQDRIPTPPMPPVRLPTPPPPEPPKKVSLSDYLKNRKIMKKPTTEAGTPTASTDDIAPAAAPAPASISESTLSVLSTITFPLPTSEVKPDMSTQPESSQGGFNMFDFLPSSRSPQPLPPLAMPTPQVPETPRVVSGGNSFTPRSEYAPPTPTTTTPALPPTTAFQPRPQSSYTPRPTISTDLDNASSLTVPSYFPRTSSTPVEDSKPLPEVDEIPNGRDYGYGRFGGQYTGQPRSVSSSTSTSLDDHLPISSTAQPSFRPRQRSTSESPVKSSVPLPEHTISMPPPLPYREPPPHQSQPRQYTSASLSPETRTSGLPFRSPIDRTSPLPRLPPTGPKAAQPSVPIPPTGPRGNWQTPTSANASTSTSAGSTGAGSATPSTPVTTPAAPSGPRGPLGPIPIPGQGHRGAFGGNMRFFEPRGTWRGRGLGRGHHIAHGARGR